jgi:hypothetical protein
MIAIMHRFSRYAPLVLRACADPGMEDRSGPPLTRGSLFTLLRTVAGEDFPAEDREALRDIDADGWYLGQHLETLLNKLEDRDAVFPELAGRNIYFMFRTQLQTLGIHSATELVMSLPSMWVFATRGDSGTWRPSMKGKWHAIVEADQPYNCRFEAGGLRGFIEAFDGFDVELRHTACRRDGDPVCIFEARWQE